MNDVRLIAETDTVLVLDKPAGLIVHSDGRTIEPSLAEWIAEKYPALATVGEPWISPQGEHIRVCGLVHRLDRTTSGVILAAKTLEAFAYLKQEFKARRVQKSYRAIVHGHLTHESDRIIAEIARSSAVPRRWYAKLTTEDDVRAAITDVVVLERLTDPMTGERFTRIEAQPLTGRTHQIRVHLASLGHPIVGDVLYAGRLLLGFERPALHAYSISLRLSGTAATFVAPLPADFTGIETELAHARGSATIPT